MKFSFLFFLAGITVFSLYGKNFAKKTTGDITRAVKSFQETTGTVQKPVNKEQLETLKNLNSELGFSADKPMVEVDVVSPIMDKLGQAIPKDVPKNLTEIAAEFYLKKVEALKLFISEYNSKITFFAVLIVFISFISKWLDIYKLAYLLSRLGWFFSQFTLVILSLAAISIWFSLKKNLWLDVGSNLFFIPLQVLAASSFAFKIMDSNFPVWNRLFGSFILPIVSGIATNAIRFL
ncbi:MAG TPA: hypothetical protein DCX95_04645 [Elusimicrobia bacterium]|nr:hypothetical protein [Elusimicrobiota bacterium]